MAKTAIDMQAIETKYPYAQILPIAQRVLAELAPHCHRIEIAGSIRRQKEMCKDIEIVAIPKAYEPGGFFESGIATVVNRWPKVKGELPCLYTQRILPEGIKLDLFFATHENWGYIYLLRTGSREFNFEWMMALKRKHYQMHDGGIYANKSMVVVREEMDVFKLINMQFVEPEKRNS